MSSEKDYSGGVLNNPVSIGDLVKDGVQFEINTNFGENFSSELFDYDNFSDSENEDFREVIISPWEKSFNELRQQMIKINEDLYKRVIQSGDPKSGFVPECAYAVVHYNAYWENESAPFDSSYMRGQPHKIYCGRNQVLQGVETALRTMLKGEEAQFLISYRLLFGEMGCPPRIKPKADSLFIIKLLKFTCIEGSLVTDDVPQEDCNKFYVVFERVKSLHTKGVYSFESGNIKTACREFHEAVSVLELCILGNQREQDEQREFLVKLYINLAVCYNRLNLPQKVCCMCNELRKITNINQHCKALFQEGRALLMIGEFNKARDRLIQAQKLEPRNQKISKELKLLDHKYEKYKKFDHDLCTKAMGILEEGNNKNAKKDIFKEGIKRSLEEFKQKIDSVDQFTLPAGLSVNEINCVEQLVNELELKLSVTMTGNSKSYVISKLT